MNKYTLQGIGDYLKDCWHDFWFWWWDALENFSHRRLSRTYCWKKNDGCFTKEGDLKHYIEQRKMKGRVK